MPTELRFDDLDLREEPHSAARVEATDYTGAPPKQGEPDGYSLYQCTRICCV